MVAWFKGKLLAFSCWLLDALIKLTENLNLRSNSEELKANSFQTLSSIHSIIYVTNLPPIFNALRLILLSSHTILFIFPKNAFLNQTPEQIARDEIDRQLLACSWVINGKKKFNLAAASHGVAIQEFQKSAGPADYVLIANKKPVDLIEAKLEDEGIRLTMHEEQSTEYATAKLKFINNDALPLYIKSIGELTTFTYNKDLDFFVALLTIFCFSILT